jgi:hypothetical protein
MVLDVDGEALDLGPDRRPFGDRPALQHAVHLQTEVVVKPPGGVLLDDEEAPAPCALAPERLRSPVGIPLPAVGVELGRSLVDH